MPGKKKDEKESLATYRRIIVKTYSASHLT